MNDNLTDVMVDKFKILILYALRNIKVADIRKIILEKAFGKYYMTRINIHHNYLTTLISTYDDKLHKIFRKNI